jgi:peptide/nickel transport system permease protein
MPRSDVGAAARPLPAVVTPPEAALPPRASWWQRSDALVALRASPATVVALGVLALLVLATVFGPWVSPHNPFDPGSLDLMDGLTAPLQRGAGSDALHWLGTDDQGRDVLSAILYGLRSSLFIAVTAVAFSVVLGVTLGLAAGYVGGALDAFIMRLADVQHAFPTILVALLIYGVARGFTPPHAREAMAAYVLVVAIGLSDWVQYARTVRAAARVERGKDYVNAARLLGLPGQRIMWRHVLPNVAQPVLVLSTLSVASAIMTEATLSFLGVGVPATQPSLGTLIRIGQGFLFSGEWWIFLFPAITLIAITLSANMVGDWLRDLFDPRLR